MKYTLKQISDGSHLLMRHGEPASNPIPNNVEIEFWLRIEELQESLQAAIAREAELLKALQAIVKHQETIGGALAKISVTWRIATKAIEKAVGRGEMLREGK